MKMSDILLTAVEVVLSTYGDTEADDGDFACVDSDSIINLERELSRLFELDRDEIVRSDIPAIKARVFAHDRLTEENKRLREALEDLVETSDTNERQLSQELLEFHRESTALVNAKQLLSELSELDKQL